MKKPKKVKSIYPTVKLIKAIERMAKKEGRSWSSMIIYILEQAVADGSR